MRALLVLVNNICLPFILYVQTKAGDAAKAGKKKWANKQVLLPLLFTYYFSICVANEHYKLWYILDVHIYLNLYFMSALEEQFLFGSET